MRFSTAESLPAQERKKPITFFELQQKRSELEKKLRQIRTRGKFSVIFNIYNDGKIIKDQEAACQEMIDELKSKGKERLKNIFTTEDGSYYIVLHTGECWRIEKNKSGYEMKTIDQKVFYIDDQKAEEYNQAHSEKGLAAFQELVLNKYLVKQEIAKGVHPVTFGLEDLPAVDYEETDEALVIKSVRDSNVYAGFNVGKKIEQIIQ